MGLSTSIFHKTLEANPKMIQLNSFISLLRLALEATTTAIFFICRNNHKNGQMKLRIYIFFARIFRLRRRFSKIRQHGTEPKSFSAVNSHNTRENLFMIIFRCHNFQIRLLISTNALRLTTQNSFPSERQKTT